MSHLSLYILAILFPLIQAAAAPAFQSPVPRAQEEAAKKQEQENQTPNTQEKKKKKAPQPINVTWNQYLSDYEPTYRQNLGPLFTPPRLMKKYENKQVTWTGVYKADLGKEDSAAPLIAMKARTIPVKDMFGSVQNISITTCAS